MSRSNRDPLDEALAAVPREVQPERDLWPQIRAQLDARPGADAGPARGLVTSRWMQLAAGVLLVLASSVMTYVFTRQALQPGVQLAHETLPVPTPSAQPAGFSFGPDTLGAEYLEARATLATSFQQRIAGLPPAARAKLERNLADLRQAADEISATLAEHPSDPLLQELLLSTYQSELRLLADASELPTTSSMRIDL